MAAKNPLDIISTNVNVGIDEVVAIFVSRYETDLFNKKDRISDQIKKLKASIDKFTADLVKSVDKKEYELAVPKLGLTFKVDEVEVHFDKPEHYGNRKIGIHVSVGMWDKEESRTYASHTKVVVLPIDSDIIAQRKALNEELEQLNLQLIDVLGLIKSVSRKERQVRGKIAEMKMEQAGQSELLANGELTKLISMN